MRGYIYKVYTHFDIIFLFGAVKPRFKQRFVLITLPSYPQGGFHRQTSCKLKILRVQKFMRIARAAPSSRKDHELAVRRSAGARHRALGVGCSCSRARLPHHRGESAKPGSGRRAVARRAVGRDLAAARGRGSSARVPCPTGGSNTWTTLAPDPKPRLKDVLCRILRTVPKQFQNSSKRRSKYFRTVSVFTVSEQFPCR
jgi:hypothetical protein